MKTTLLVLGTALLAMAACSPQQSAEPGASLDTVAESAADSITAAQASAMESAAELGSFTGRWQGVEGTSLTVTPVGDAFQITVVDLDGPRDFTGEGVADGIQFTRDGQVHTIRKGTGDDTGMKWLAGKKDCIVVAANEGYCHD